MNPCIDCRILFFRKSKELMRGVGALFIITGEVLGQRPMSQFKRQMDIIEKEAGLEGLVVRPLSAKLLPPTIPEKLGWINREKLLDITGRSRKRQIVLAKEFGINDYPCAAGGCLLTDAGFARKVKDLITHDELNLSNIQLLKSGRYFRFSKETKLVVGRNEKENKALATLAREGDLVFRPLHIQGPLGIGRGFFDPNLINLSCKIVARYSDRDGNNSAEISYGRIPEAESSLITSPLGEDELERFRV